MNYRVSLLRSSLINSKRVQSAFKFAARPFSKKNCHEVAVGWATGAPSQLLNDVQLGKRQGGVLLTSLSAMSVGIRVARSSPNGSMSEEASKNS